MNTNMGWQPIETAPRSKCGGSILGYRMTIDGPSMAVIFWHDLPKHVYADQNRWTTPGWQNSHCGHVFNPTHWMPLPELPK